MRLTRFIPVAVMATLAAMSCNPVEEIKPATEVTGTYSGWSKAEFQYSPTPMVGNTQKSAIPPTPGEHSPLRGRLLPGRTAPTR